MYFNGLSSSGINQKDVGAFYGINRTNRINDAQMSEMKNVDCESFPYLATRRGRNCFYSENEMAIICHDTDITDDYKVTGVTRDGNFVYRGTHINCDNKLAGNNYVCEYLGDYVCFPRRQIITSFQSYAEETIYDVESFSEKREAEVLFGEHTSKSETCGRFIVRGARGELSVLGAEDIAVFTSAVASGKIREGLCFVPVFRSCHSASALTTSPLPAPDDVFMCIDYINADEYKIMFSFYDLHGNAFNYGQWLSDNKEDYSGSNFPSHAVINGSYAGLTLGIESNGLYYNCTSLQLDYVSAPMYVGASYGGRLFACDVFGIDIFYSSAVDRYDFSPGTSLGDAGSVQCADSGRWTALVSYGGALYAFKKNGMYKIYSSDGLNFYMDKVCDIGTLSPTSVCVVSDVMYFWSETGFYKFTGTYPSELSDALGRTYTGAVLGGYDDKVYCSLKYSGGTELAVYDARIGVYGVHDEFSALGFVTYGGRLYSLNSEDGYVYEMLGEREAVEFSIQTRKFFLSFQKKAINGIRLYFEFSGGQNEKFQVSVSYDGGEWEKCFKPVTSGKLKYIPIKFKKCDELCVKIEGNGVFTLKGMTLSLYSGGDVRQNR